MIDWERTRKEFLIDSPDEISVKKRPTIAMTCDNCNISGTKKMRCSADLEGKWLCRKCAMNVPETKKRVHKAIVKFNKREYSKSTKEKMSNNLKNKWKDKLYKDKISKIASKNLKKRWEDDEFKKFISLNSKKNWANQDYRNKMVKSLAKSRENMPRISSIQEILYSILDDLNIPYYREYKDKPADPETIIGPYSFDCVIPLKDKKLLIECQGDYWHSLDKTKTNDHRKSSYITNNFPEYELKYLWEHEFKCKEKISELIKYWFGITKIEMVDFSFNDIEIKECEAKDYKLLLSKYHYLPNAGRGGIAYGAYINNELIAVCIFSPLNRQNMPWDKDSTRELSRFCINPRYQKKNLASWFMSRCIKQLNPKYQTIISYCDTTFDHDGAIYKACNFKLDGEVRPDYWYVSKDGWITHKKSLYNHAVKMNMKEKDYATKLGYRKIYGKKKLRFIFERRRLTC